MKIIITFQKFIFASLLALTPGAHASNLKQFFGGAAKTHFKKTYTTSGTWTHPTPGNAIKVEVTAIGGGGAGLCAHGPSSNYPTATAGSASSFGALVTANGGGEATYSGPGDGASRGTCEVLMPAGYNVYNYQLGGPGGDGLMGFGNGGNAYRVETYNAGTVYRTCGGGSGFVSTGNHSVTSNQTITVGSGGTCGTLTQANGKSGAVIVEWWE